MTDERPYRRYRARPRFLAPGGASIEELRRRAPASGGEPVAAPPASGGARPREVPPAPPPTRPPRERRPGGIGWRRVLKWVVLGVVGWIALSIVLFLVSAQFFQDRVDEATRSELSGPTVPVVRPMTVLVLGSDLRAKGTKEPGAATSGPSRSDSIQLLRVGGGHSAKLSIPRDTAVEIPGYGLNKINAAYALGGSALAVKTVKRYLGIEIDHVVLVNFEKFPQLIDAMGGIDYTGGCVVSRINGGFRNGGYTLRLRPGTTHLDGRQALALARTRTNECNRRENDLTRERRQQKIIAAMKSQVLSPTGFLRLPLIAWRTPQTISSDMGALGLTGFMATVATAGDAPTRVLRPTGALTLPDGGAALVVSQESRERQVRRFLER